MQRARGREREARDRRFKLGAILRQHLVATVHRPDFGGELRAALVLKRLPRRQNWLLSDDPFTVDFMSIPIAVSNDPVAADQLGSDRPRIANLDGVAKHKLLLSRIRVIGQILGFWLNRNFILFRHGVILA